MPRQGLGHSSVDIYNMVTPGTDDPVWRNKTSGQLMVGYQQTRSNFVLFSQDATDAEAWSKTNVAADSTLYEAPDNSTTANAIKSDSTGEKAYNITQGSLSVTAGKTYTLSVHFKKQNLDFARIYFSDGASKTADFNLNTGAVGTTSNTLETQVDAMDDGWYRCSMTFVATSTVSSGQARFYAQSASGDNTPNVAVSGVVLIYVWGFQLEENSEMSAYIVTTNAARTTTETLNDTSETWDFDSADLMPEADPDDDGVWEIPDNIVLNGDYEELGSELVTNGDFSSFTGDNPDNFTVLNEDADNFVTESSGQLRMVSDNSATIAIRANPIDMLTTGKVYKVSVDLTFTTGTLDISGTQFNTSGTKVFYLTAPADYIQLAKASTLDVLIDNLSIKQVDPNNRWSLGTGWSISDGKAVAVATSSSGFSITQNNVLTAGVPHEITFTVSERTAGNVRFRADAVSGTTRSADGTYTEIITPAGHQFAIQGLDSFVGKIDNVSVKEYAITPLDV